MPVTVVPRSAATVAIETFMTELSRVMRNCADASVSSTVAEAAAAAVWSPDEPGAPSVGGHPTIGEHPDRRRLIRPV